MYLFNSMQEFCMKSVVKHTILCHFSNFSCIFVVVCYYLYFFGCNGQGYPNSRPTARTRPLATKCKCACKVGFKIALFCANFVVFRLILNQNRTIFGEKRMLFSRTIGCCVAQHIEIFAYSEKCPYLCGTLKT